MTKFGFINSGKGEIIEGRLKGIKQLSNYATSSSSIYKCILFVLMCQWTPKNDWKHFMPSSFFARCFKIWIVYGSQIFEIPWCDMSRKTKLTKRCMYAVELRLRRKSVLWVECFASIFIFMFSITLHFFHFSSFQALKCFFFLLWSPSKPTSVLRNCQNIVKFYEG